MPLESSKDTREFNPGLDEHGGNAPLGQTQVMGEKKKDRIQVEVQINH
jgi:hypothetical protein